MFASKHFNSKMYFESYKWNMRNFYCQKCKKELITNRFATKEWYKTVDLLFVCIKDEICVYCFDF